MLVFGSLGAGAFVQNAGMVLTYLVMVVQMQPLPDPNTGFSIFDYGIPDVQSLIEDKVTPLPAF